MQPASWKTDVSFNQLVGRHTTYNRTIASSSGQDDKHIVTKLHLQTTRQLKPNQINLHPNQIAQNDITKSKRTTELWRQMSRTGMTSIATSRLHTKRKRNLTVGDDGGKL